MKMHRMEVPFTQVANEVLQDQSLTLKAKGMFSILFSKPEGWQFSAKRLVNESKDAYESTIGAIKELEDGGYLSRVKKGDGRTVYEIAYKVGTEPSPEKPNKVETLEGDSRTVSKTDDKQDSLKKKTESIFTHWLSRNLIQHKKLTSGMERAAKKALKDYELEEITEAITLYSTVLEKGVAEADRKYFWTYEWGLEEFLQRGLKKFAGSTASNFKKKVFEAAAKKEQRVDSFA